MAECILSNLDNTELHKPLIHQYKAGRSAYFSSPSNTILARPPFVNLLDVGMKNLNQQVIESLRFAAELGQTDTVVIGAIPFDISKPTALRLSSQFEQEEQKTLTKTENFDAPDLGAVSIKSVPKPQEFTQSVSDALAKFSDSELNKVVLSRTLELKTEKVVDISKILHRLKMINTAGYTFAVPVNYNSQRICNKTLLGASPELLIKKAGNKIIANPLAGSEPMQHDTEADSKLITQLMNSKKDRYEHDLVIRSIEAALKPFCKTLHVPAEPSVIHTETMWHLSTCIEGELISPDITSLEIAMAMHPTPAIGGYPAKQAIKAINELEHYDRNLFTGMVGWCNASGDGEWVVTIRCAEIDTKNVTLYAGAGIVKGSEPEKELNETGAKFNTMLNALGLNIKGQDIE